jgi:hypothetical protein
MAEIIHLLIADGPDKGSEITIPPGGAVVGRDENSEIHIDCQELSRKHCRFFFRGGQLHVQDLSSANDTLVNNEPTREQPLEEHDVVSTGTVKFMVMLNKITPAFDLHRLEKLPLTSTVAAATASKAPPPPAPAPSDKDKTTGTLGKILATVLLVLIWGFLAISVLYPPPGQLERPPSSAAPRAAAVPVPEPVAPTELRNDRSLEDFKRVVTQKLLADEYAAASTLITEQLAPGQSSKYQKELSAMLRTVESISTMNTTIASGFKKQIGREITLHRNGRKAQITPRAVFGERVEATIEEDGKERTITFNVSKLSAVDRLEWLPFARSPEAHAMHFMLNLKAGDMAEAAIHANSSGSLSTFFGQALANQAL